MNDWKPAIRGAIFDLDGTLLDSTPYWGRAPEVYLESLGVRAESGLGQVLFPMTLQEASEYVIRAYGLSQSTREVMDGINAVMRSFYLEEVELKPGVRGLLDALAERGIPMAVASVTDKHLVEAVLRRHGVLDRFRTVATTDEAGVGKQEPKVYLMAAERIGCPPERALVFEDALHALRTANRAGFVTVGVNDDNPADAEIRAEARYYLPDFFDLSPIRKLIDG